MAEKKFWEVGCDWWSSYPENEEADQFAMAVGFTYTHTNSYMGFDQNNAVTVNCEGIRACTLDDYPIAPNIWSREYAAMHRRLGIPLENKEQTKAEQEEEYLAFVRNLDDYYVIEENGDIVGVGVLFDDHSGIGALAVDANYGGKGYGTKLASFLTQECIRRGHHSPCLYCETGNDHAMYIYRKIGYSEQSRESIAVKCK